MKVCSRCYENKSLSDFHSDPRYRLGVTGWCRSCRNDFSKQRAAEIKTQPKPTIKTKRCPTCKSTKPIKNFSRSASKCDGFASRCKNCRHSAERPSTMMSDRHKNNHLWTHYRMRIPDLQKMMEAQGHKCAICGDEWVRPTVDHDHVTMAVRGLLCSKCNSQLRAVEDDLFANQARDYLEHHRKQTPIFRATKNSDNASRRASREQLARRRA